MYYCIFTCIFVVLQILCTCIFVCESITIVYAGRTDVLAYSGVTHQPLYGSQYIFLCSKPWTRERKESGSLTITEVWSCFFYMLSPFFYSPHITLHTSEFSPNQNTVKPVFKTTWEIGQPENEGQLLQSLSLFSMWKRAWQIRPPQNSGQFFTVPWVFLIPRSHCTSSLCQRDGSH